MEQGRFRLNVKRKFVTMSLVKYWNGLPGDVVKAPSLEMFNIKLDGALSYLI